jgi:hypothetical protein
MLNSYILTEKEANLKDKIWYELNKDWLED